MRWFAATETSAPTKIATTSPIDYGDAEVVRAFATSKDGTKVPLNIVRRKGIKLDGSNPVLLYGYGGYGVNQNPGFLGAQRRLWLDAGGFFVVANIRGGGEYGERWHLQGNLTRKQNVLRRLLRLGPLADRQRLHHIGAAGAAGRFQRRAADGRDAHPASRARPRRGLLGRGL